MKKKTSKRDDGAIRVAQALHGYRKGHELLAVSCELSNDANRALLELSDLSGHAVRTHGFESYVTGFPVPGERLYALARTWLAKGAERPGSVWTHTLLLTPDQVALTGIANLTSHFRQPSSISSIPDYRIPLEVKQSDLAEVALESSTPREWKQINDFQALFQALFGDATTGLSVLLPADTSKEHEESLLLLWSLLWPELRSRFSFSSGSLAMRYVGGRAFDLQVVPSDRASMIHRAADSEDIVLIDRSWEMETSDVSLGHFGGSTEALREFRIFCHRFGPELSPERQSVGRLARLVRYAEVLSDRADWRSLLELVGAWYPLDSKARALKEWSLAEAASNRFEPFTSVDRLAVLSELTSPDAFAGWSSSISMAFLESLSANRPNSEVPLADLFSLATTRARETLLQLSANHLDAGRYVRLIGSLEVTAALVAIGMRPSVLGERLFWQSERATQAGLKWLNSEEVIESPIKPMIRAVIEAGQPVTLSELVDLVGIEAAVCAFDILDEDRHWGEAGTLAPEWVSFIQSIPEQGSSWLARSEGPSTTLAKLVLLNHQPTDRWARDLDNSRWTTVAGSIDRDSPDAVAVLAFALGVGFHDRTRSGSSLVAEAFQPVHESAAEGMLKREDWKKLKRVLPEPRRGSHWLGRKAKRSRASVLRRALVDVFARRGWAVTTFLDAVKDNEILAQVTAENARTLSGMTLARRLRTAVRRGDLVLSERQRDALSPWLDP